MSEVVLVPRRLVEKNFPLFPHLRKESVARCMVMLDGMAMCVPGYYMKLEEARQLDELGENEIRKVGEFISPDLRTGEVWGYGLDAVFVTKDSSVNNQSSDAVMDFLNIFSELTYMSVELSTKVVESKRRFPNTLYFVLAHPHFGDWKTIKAHSIFGLSLDETLGQEIPYSGPVRGRGGVHLDTEEVPCAQTIDGITYLFPPIKECHEREKISIIARSMMTAWNDRVTGNIGPPEREPISQENVVEVIKSFGDSVINAIDAQLDEIDVSIKHHTERLSSRIRARQLLENARKGIAKEVPQTEAECVDEWKKLSALPHVVGVYLVEGGLELHTDEIVTEHEGLHYRLGTYAIRFSEQGKCYISALATLHPNGVHHPHIGDSETVCYGNVTVAIIEAMAESDRVRAGELILSWLADGYDEASALVKISEWPSVENGMPEREKRFSLSPEVLERMARVGYEERDHDVATA